MKQDAETLTDQVIRCAEMDMSKRYCRIAARNSDHRWPDHKQT